MSAGDGPVTVAFVAWADHARVEDAAAYEDAVLALLTDHGARVVFRGRRSGGQPDELPAEVHLLWFPSRAAYDGFRADPRRALAAEGHGQVFTATVVVELDDLGP